MRATWEDRLLAWSVLGYLAMVAVPVLAPIFW